MDASLSAQLARLNAMLGKDPKTQMRDTFLENYRMERPDFQFDPNMIKTMPYAPGSTEFELKNMPYKNMPYVPSENPDWKMQLMRNEMNLNQNKTPFNTVAGAGFPMDTFLNAYEEGNYSPMQMKNTQDQYRKYLESIATNPQAPRVGGDNTMGRIRAAEELQRLKGLL